MKGLLVQFARKGFAIGFLVLLIGLIYGAAVVPAVNRYSALDEELQTTSELLERYQGIVGLRAQLEDVVRELTSRQSNNEAYLEGHSDALAAAEMQNTLVRAVSDHKGKLKSVQVLPPIQTAEFSKITLRVLMELSYAQLMEVLFELEISEQFVLVEGLDVRSPLNASRGSNGGPESPLAIVIDLAGFRPKESADARS